MLDHLVVIRPYGRIYNPSKTGADQFRSMRGIPPDRIVRFAVPQLHLGSRLLAVITWCFQKAAVIYCVLFSVLGFGSTSDEVFQKTYSRLHSD